jgi:hypothetical protein
MYAATFSDIAVSAIQDVFELNAPSDAVVVLHAVYLSQHTDTGDTNEEQLELQITSGHTTSGSGGATISSPPPMELGDAAFGGTVERNNTTQASGGTIVVHHAESWNTRTPFVYLPTPEMRKVLSPSARLCVELIAAPSASIDMNGTIVFEEIGG